MQTFHFAFKKKKKESSRTKRRTKGPGSGVILHANRIEFRTFPARLSTPAGALSASAQKEERLRAPADSDR